MFKAKRKRAVVLALIAFFCTTAYVSVDWRRFGGGFLAFVKTKRGPVTASTGDAPTGSRDMRVRNGETSRQDDGTPPAVAIATARRHPPRNGPGETEEDLFKYGDPAAGGIPPGSFIVARNDAPPVASDGDALVPAAAPIALEITDTPAPAGGVTSPAPAPGGGLGGGALAVVTASTPPAPTPGPAPAPGTTPPPPATPAPAPTSTQSGTTDPDGGGDTTPAPAPLPPVSAIPEASSLQMMTLAVLFAAVAAARRRKRR